MAIFNSYVSLPGGMFLWWYRAYARAMAHGAEVQISIGLGTEVLNFPMKPLGEHRNNMTMTINLFKHHEKHHHTPKTYIITFKYHSISESK